jgi:hypothetical protein
VAHIAVKETKLGTAQFGTNAQTGVVAVIEIHRLHLIGSKEETDSDLGSEVMCQVCSFDTEGLGADLGLEENLADTQCLVKLETALQGNILMMAVGHYPSAFEACAAQERFVEGR